MSASSETVEQQPAPRKQIGEWFWRFLAVVMLITVGWVVWITYQLNPAPLATNTAYEAAAKARAARSAEGMIAPAAAAAPAAAGAAPAAESPPKAEAAPKEPPVNVEKLKLSDSIASPIPDPAKKK